MEVQLALEVLVALKRFMHKPYEVVRHEDLRDFCEFSKGVFIDDADGRREHVAGVLEHENRVVAPVITVASTTDQGADPCGSKRDVYPNLDEIDLETELPPKLSF